MRSCCFRHRIISRFFVIWHLVHLLSLALLDRHLSLVPGMWFCCNVLCFIGNKLWHKKLVIVPLLEYALERKKSDIYWVSSYSDCSKLKISGLSDMSYTRAKSKVQFVRWVLLSSNARLQKNNGSAKRAMRKYNDTLFSSSQIYHCRVSALVLQVTVGTSFNQSRHHCRCTQ